MRAGERFDAGPVSGIDWRFPSRYCTLVGVKIALYAWTILLLLATHWPRPGIDLSPYGGDKTAHLAAYGLWGLLACAAHGRSKSGLLRWLLAGMVLGAVDEWTQPLFERHAEWLDWFADATGLGLGFLSVGLLRRLR